MKLTPEQLHILQHSLGLDQYAQGVEYRNHYAAGPETDVWPDLQALCAAGLMKDHGKISMWGDLHGFSVSPIGRKAVYRLSPKPPKVSRSRQRWLEWLKVADAYSGMGFGEWLKRRLYVRENAERFWKEDD